MLLYLILETKLNPKILKDKSLQILDVHTRLGCPETVVSNNNYFIGFVRSLHGTREILHVKVLSRLEYVGTVCAKLDNKLPVCQTSPNSVHPFSANPEHTVKQLYKRTLTLIEITVTI